MFYSTLSFVSHQTITDPHWVLLNLKRPSAPAPPSPPPETETFHTIFKSETKARATASVEYIPMTPLRSPLQHQITSERPQVTRTPSAMLQKLLRTDFSQEVHSNLETHFERSMTFIDAYHHQVQITTTTTANCEVKMPRPVKAASVASFNWVSPFNVISRLEEQQEYDTKTSSIEAEGQVNVAETIEEPADDAEDIADTQSIETANNECPSWTLTKTGEVDFKFSKMGPLPELPEKTTKWIYEAASVATENLDLTSSIEVTAFLNTHKPTHIIHCAAERRPDVAERDQDGVLRLNVEASRHLAAEAKRIGAWLVYVSTDYVFDGTKPPYEVEDVPNPLNFYGKTKYEGEKAVLGSYSTAAVLRVPVLYGEVEKAEESAVNVLLPIVQNTSKTTTMDDFQSRFPTNVADVAKVMRQMAAKSLSGIYHFSSKERMTKYQICAVLSEIVGGNINHLQPLREAPKEAVASRPEDAQLSTRRLEEAGVDVSCVVFKDWFAAYLKR
ncbi:Methionine adenosyltransferase 2 subunit beta [Chytridiales sp. JEL 0842]|nr:Methionine adenosyltransferase 2 subunit beta [Chytridiales sp. JEL 0842]